MTIVMMKVSTKSTYAIRAMLDLARRSDERPVRLEDIANRQQIPLPYLEQIFSKLKKGGLVQSVRGPQGGYLLAKHPEEISLADVVLTLEGPLGPVLCSLPENLSPTCHEVEGCISRVMCNELDGQLTKILARNTLATLRGEDKRLSERLASTSFQ